MPTFLQQHKHAMSVVSDFKHENVHLKYNVDHNVNDHFRTRYAITLQGFCPLCHLFATSAQPARYMINRQTMDFELQYSLTITRP